MKIGLIKLDGSPKYKNIALEKIRIYHERKGDEVRYITPLESELYDKVYCSSIFTFSDKSYVRDEWIKGGTGFDVYSKLPDEIEKIKPKINIGFTTRGCIRKCPFCLVWKKEGCIKIVADIYDIWDGKSKEIILLDNNILALPKHFFLITEQIKKENLKVDFNQGLDIRLLTSSICKRLEEIRHYEYHFAWDNIQDEKEVIKGIKLLKNAGIKRSIFYVLVGFNTTFEEDLYRVKKLREMNQNVFVMIYDKHKKTSPEYRKYRELQRYCALRRFYWKYTFEEFYKIRS